MMVSKQLFCPELFKILLRLGSYDALEGGGEVFGIPESYTVGYIADTEVWIFLGHATGCLYADVADKIGDALACKGTYFIIKRTGTGSHISCKCLTVEVAVVDMLLDTVDGAL